jgi:hypothetical protein
VNLRGIANSAIRRVNPNWVIVWKKATGEFEQDDELNRTPVYDEYQVEAQVQAISSEGLKRADGLNISGTLRTVFMYGAVRGVVRVDAKGGDILCFPEERGGPDRTWKIFGNVITWDGWSSADVVLQVDDASNN